MVKKEKGKNMLNLGKELAKISKSLDQEKVDKVRQDQLKQNDLPCWIYFADKDKKEKKVNVPLLGEQILNDYTFLLSENDDKETFYEYQPKTGKLSNLLCK